MAETRLTLEPEVKEIFQCIDHKQNFLLSGGAGSGKTYSLVQVIKQTIKENPNSRIACITYTNAAVKEIDERVNHNNLIVSTIHDFLWDNIKHFQHELKIAIINLANDENVTKISFPDINPVPIDYYDSVGKNIEYKEYLRTREGIISHDEVLIVSEYLFKNYPKLCDIVKDKFKFIFIDEYQDTSKYVIDILLKHLKQTNKNCVIGFFGDAMQAIYDDGVGNLDEFKGDDISKVKEIKKEQNRRNPNRIIGLANRLRTDGLVQIPSADSNAPNMVNGQVKEGTISFLYSSSYDLTMVRQYLSQNQNWNFENPQETKELNLTHNLIAFKAGFKTLMDIYDKDYILDFVHKIKKYNKDNNIQTDFSAMTFGEVVAFLQHVKSGKELSKVSPTDKMQSFITSNQDLYQVAQNYNYDIISSIYIDKDLLIDDKKQDEFDDNLRGSKRDNLIKHLFKIERNISLYKKANYNEFLRTTDYRNKLVNIEAKTILAQNIQSLINVGDKSIEEIITEADLFGICLIDDKLEEFKTQKKYVYDRVKDVKYSEFQKLFEYLEGFTPFSTQHKTKGTEFNNVFVILDNGGWNNYNFEKLFIGNGTPSVMSRSQKIFYMCCTRAKENLSVFFHNPTPAIITKANEWFGVENTISLDN